MYSVSRLLSENFDDLPESINLGGQLVVTTEGQLLVGQGASFEILQGLPKELHGHFIKLTFFSKSLNLESQQIHYYVKAQSLGESHPEFFFQPNFSMEVQKNWSQFLNFTRNFFVKLGLVELLTPSLVPSPGMEANLFGFETMVTFGGQCKNLYLPTSPEFHLKKFLSLGFTDFFEIKTCFRNEENSALHSNEFQMLEWYRAFMSLEDLEKEALQFLFKACEHFQVGVPHAVEKLSFVDAFRKFADFHLHPKTQKEELFECSQRLGLPTQEHETFEEIINWFLVEVIEPQFDPSKLTVLHSYPPSMAALSKLNSKGWAMRFEFYWKGLELLNAFDELTDVKEQKRRFKKENQVRRQRQQKEIPEDEEFYEALKRGVPPTVGAALGLDRMFMAMWSLKDIQEVQPFLKKF